MDNRYLIQNYMFKDDFVTVVKAKGVKLYDAAGKEYLDCSASPLSNTLGYGNEEMIDTISEQLKQLSFAYRVELENPMTNQAAADVSDWTGGKFDKIFFVSGGSEATEAVMGLAKEYHLAKGKPGKYKIISRWISYHGSTKGALSISGLPLRRNMMQQYFPEMGHIPPAYCYQCWYGKEPGSCNLECAKALEDEIIMQDPNTVAAFIMEPLSGTSLAAAYPINEKYYAKVREICDKYDVLLIYDEVMTGFGRTGYNMAMDRFQVKPDMFTFGKSVSGGYYPAGGVATTSEIIAPIKDNIGLFPVGYTWCGNPVVSRVISKTLEIYKRDNLVEKVKKDGEHLLYELNRMASLHPTMGDIRGLGLMIGVEFVEDKGSKQPIKKKDKSFAAAFGHNCVERGMIIEAMSGNNIKAQAGDLALWGPQYVTSTEDYNKMLQIFDECLAQTEKEFGFK
jgi:adenosylmethionine-8-amino-7-oxononanoate aminotransferase